MRNIFSSMYRIIYLAGLLIGIGECLLEEHLYQFIKGVLFHGYYQ